MKAAIKNKPLNSQALTQHTKQIFALSQNFPPSALALLLEKRRRQLSQKQQREIYDQIKEKNIFPILTNPKSLIQFCYQLTVQIHKVGQRFTPSQHCYIVLEGAIKIYEQSRHHRHHSHMQSEDSCRTYDLNLRLPPVQPTQNLRLSLSNFGVSLQNELHKIQRRKITVGQAILLDQNSSRYQYIVTSTVTLLKIPYNIHYAIASSTLMIEIKKKQQFFSKIPHFQRHYRLSLQDFVNSLEQITCGFGKKIFNEGSFVQYVYIVKEGEFILQKNVSTDDIIVKQGKAKRIKSQSSESIFENQIKNTIKHFRSCPYKLIGQKQIIGDCEYLFNRKLYMYSMRCHKEGSKLYRINSQLFFKKLYVIENPIEKANKIIEQNYLQQIKQIEKEVKFNQSNLLILKIMPNNNNLTIKNVASHSKQKNVQTSNSFSKQRVYNSTQRSVSFFQKMNKTIINHNKNSLRKKNNSKNIEKKPNQIRKIYKTPAVVQQIVQIVNQKRAYHKLRNLGMQRTDAFQFDANNVPPFIKKKYAHILERKGNK